MAVEIIDDQTLSLVEKTLPYIGSTMFAIGAFIAKAAGSKMDKLTSAVEDHQERICILEQTSVSREDLEHVMETLQRDLRSCFERTHNRIDEIYRNPRKD
jgi:4-hydroxy-3-methylbut-2-enyl diphosphate reductase IspH